MAKAKGVRSPVTGRVLKNPEKYYNRLLKSYPEAEQDYFRTQTARTHLQTKINIIKYAEKVNAQREIARSNGATVPKTINLYFLDKKNPTSKAIKSLKTEIAEGSAEFAEKRLRANFRAAARNTFGSEGGAKISKALSNVPRGTFSKMNTEEITSLFVNLYFGSEDEYDEKIEDVTGKLEQYNPKNEMKPKKKPKKKSKKGKKKK
jgi:hypothetical protein